MSQASNAPRYDHCGLLREHRLRALAIWTVAGVDVRRSAHLRDWEKRAESAWETPKLPRSGVETKLRAESCLRSRRAYETGLGGMNGD